MNCRDSGKCALGTVLKQNKNISIIENNVYKVTMACMAVGYDEGDFTKLYTTHLYQTVGDIIDEIPLKDILSGNKIRDTVQSIVSRFF